MLEANLRRFYKMFHISPIKLDYPDNFDEFYPEITDSMYLELLALNIKHWRDDYILRNRTPHSLKQEILSDCCYMVDGLLDTPKKRKIIKSVHKIIQEA